jgi:hypothetical protein
VEICPDCRNEETHAEDCLVGWNHNLSNLPTTVAQRNPFLSMMKGDTDEHPHTPELS